MAVSAAATTTTTTTTLPPLLRKRQRDQTPRGVVHFKSTVKIISVAYLIPAHADYDETAVQHSDIWYTSREYKAMAKRDAELIHSRRRRSSKTGESQQQEQEQQPSKRADDDEDSVLGLENRSVRKYRRSRMNAGLSSVLKEQQRQWELDQVVDPELIARQYEDVSEEAEEEARLRAIKLASSERQLLSRRMIKKKLVSSFTRSSSPITASCMMPMDNNNNMDCSAHPPLRFSAGGAGRWDAAPTSSSPITCCSGTSKQSSLFRHRDSLVLLATAHNNNSATRGLRLPVRSGSCY